jgi:hypothetical protein
MNPEILTALERCDREAWFRQRWYRHRMPAMEMFNTAIRAAMLADVPSAGEYAGQYVISLGKQRGLLSGESADVYRTVINHASAADLCGSMCRKDGELPWSILDGTLTDRKGTHFREILGVSRWSDARKLHEVRSWYTLGQVCKHKLPMKLIVIVLGPLVRGRRTGYFSRGYYQYRLNKLRFRKRDGSAISDKFEVAFREENDHISKDDWIQSMYQDGVLSDSLFVIDIPVPSEPDRLAVIDLQERLEQRFGEIQSLPTKQLSTCDDPVSPCPFRSCCWSSPESLPEEGGFDPVE